MLVSWRRGGDLKAVYFEFENKGGLLFCILYFTDNKRLGYLRSTVSKNNQNLEINYDLSYHFFGCQNRQNNKLIFINAPLFYRNLFIYY